MVLAYELLGGLGTVLPADHFNDTFSAFDSSGDGADDNGETGASAEAAIPGSLGSVLATNDNNDAAVTGSSDDGSVDIREIDVASGTPTPSVPECLHGE